MSAGGAGLALAARLARDPVHRLAVIQTAFLGDTVFSAALATGLRGRFPDATIIWVATPRGRDVAAAIPGVDEVLVYDKRGADRGLAGFLRTASSLRARDCQLAVLPHRSLRSALLAWRAGIPERLGFAQAPGRLLYTATARDPGGPFLAREAALLSTLGAAPGPMRLAPSVESVQRAKEKLAGAGMVGTQNIGTPNIGIPINAGAPRRYVALALGSEWETKIWPADHTAELARRLSARGLIPVLLGGPREKPLAAAILEVAPGAIDTTGNPIGEALALISQCELCIGGDSGLAHAARGLGVPTLLLFGPTDPALHQLGVRERALSLRLDCSPCGAHGAHRCPLGHHRCLRDLSVDQVEEAALQLLAPCAGDSVQ